MSELNPVLTEELARLRVQNDQLAAKVCFLLALLRNNLVDGVALIAAYRPHDTVVGCYCLGSARVEAMDLTLPLIVL